LLKEETNKYAEVFSLGYTCCDSLKLEIAKYYSAEEPGGVDAIRDVILTISFIDLLFLPKEFSSQFTFQSNLIDL